jgi:nucleoid-associated protein YgaU
MSEASERRESPSSREWTKFVILAVILLGTIVVVALLRPFIFNRAVPAVMGERQLTAPMPAEAIEEAYPAEEEFVPVVPLIEETPAPEPYPTGEENETMAGEELPTAVSTISYTVQHGDTILSIARRHNVSVEAITAANNIKNPNHIEVGTTLLIPQP